MLFDGEEAFVSWSNTDSLYGSRHLAAEMEKQGGLLSVGDKTGLEAIVSSWDLVVPHSYEVQILRVSYIL